MGRITEFEVYCGLGLNLAVIAVTALVGVLAYTV